MPAKQASALFRSHMSDLIHSYAESYAEQLHYSDHTYPTLEAATKAARNMFADDPLCWHWGHWVELGEPHATAVCFVMASRRPKGSPMPKFLDGWDHEKIERHIFL